MTAEDQPPAGRGVVWDSVTFKLGLDQLEAAPGEMVRIYSPARTVVDLMRMRRKLGSPSHTSRCAASWPVATPESVS